MSTASGDLEVSVTGSLGNLVDFGNVYVGETSRRRVIVRNMGRGPIDPIEFQLSGNPFELGGPLQWPELAPASAFEVDLVFKPQARGRFWGRFAVSSGRATVEFELTGDGEYVDAGSPGRCWLTVEPQSLDFGTLEPGASKSIPLRIRNTNGDGRCSLVLSIESDRTGFRLVDFDVELPAFSETTTWVLFAPDDFGSSYSAVLSVGERSGASTRSVQLVGASAPWCPRPPPDDTCPKADGRIYLTKASELWALDPDDGNLTRIGQFVENGRALSSVSDIAVSADGTVWILAAHLYVVDPQTALVRRALEWTQPANSLEALSDGKLVIGGKGLYAFDPIARTVGAVLDSEGFSSSGDLEQRSDGKILWVFEGGDSIAVIDPVARSVESITDIGIPKLWGLASVGETVYGFTNTGRWVSLDPYSLSVTNDQILSGAWTGAGSIP